MPTLSRAAKRRERTALRAAPAAPIATPSRPQFGAAMEEDPGRRSAVRETHPWIQADVDRIHNAILYGLQGRPAQLQDIYDDMLDRDGRVSACSRTRCLALVGRPWAVKPAPGMEQDPEAKRIAEECHDILAAIPRWPVIVGELAEGITKGFAVQEIMWGVDRRGRYVPKDFKWRAQNRFVWQPETLQLARKDLGDPYWGVSLGTIKPDGFVVHSPKAGRAAYVTRGGVLISCLVPALAKKHGNKWWFKGLERDGVPLPVLNLPAGADGGAPSPDVIAESKKILRNMAASWGAVTWGGMEFLKAPSTGDFTGDAHDKLIGVANVEIAIILLGQNLTTEVQGGSLAAATAHNYVRGDYLAADLVELAVTVREQIIERVVRFNWPGGPVPIYETSADAKSMPTLLEVEAGVFSEDELRSLRGFAPKADGAGAEYRRTVPAAASAGAGFVPPAAAASPGGAPAASPLRSQPVTVLPRFPTRRRP